MKILQFIGYKNSGKTTLLQQVLERLVSLDYTVGTIKHHGHGHSVPFVKPSMTDGERFFNSGASASALCSDTESLVYLNNTFTIEDCISLYTLKGLDWVLIEGFKTLPYSKIVLAREDQDFPSVYTDSPPIGLPPTSELYLRGNERTVDAVMSFLHKV